MKRYALLILGLFILAGCTAGPADTAPENGDALPPDTGEVTPPTETATGAAQAGDLVAVEYVGTLASGEVFDASQGEPLEFVLGDGMILPGFEQAIVGMEVGETSTFTLSPAEAYGERVEQTQEVPIEEFGDEQPEVGMPLTLIDPETQQPVTATILEVGEEMVTLDMNHPLAGEELTFEVELLDVSDAPEQQGQAIDDIVVE